jgi:hypothetical protein
VLREMNDEKDKERAAHLGAPHRKQVRVLECDPHDDRFRQAGQTATIPLHRNIEAIAPDRFRCAEHVAPWIENFHQDLTEVRLRVQMQS